MDTKPARLAAPPPSSTRPPPASANNPRFDSFEAAAAAAAAAAESYCDGGKLFPEAVREVSLSLLASDVVEGVGEVALHLGSRVRGLEALHVLVNQGDQTRDVTPGDLIGGRRQESADM